MTKSIHNIYIGGMVAVVVIVTAYLSYTGYSYYNTALDERFYHPHHTWFKPSGAFGHGIGILGTLMILFGVGIYIARKRYLFLARFIRLKYLLEFHIFLCVLGPILILFHTAFKFGGIVSIAFWSMVAVVLSGVIGRFIYIQIPRTIEGRELSLQELQGMKIDFSTVLGANDSLSNEQIKHLLPIIQDSLGQKENKGFVRNYFQAHSTQVRISKELKKAKVKKKDRKAIIKILRKEFTLSDRINRLQMMQQLFKYWHVAHLPFALIMLIIAIVHVIITLTFGYKWIF